jgi:hypothetical protein
MRMSGLFRAAIALSMLTPIAPVHALMFTPGDLFYTDFYKWQGQYGTPTWREILVNLGGAEGLTFYLWNAPSPPPVTNPADPSVGAGDPLDSIGTPGAVCSALTASGGDPLTASGEDSLTVSEGDSSVFVTTIGSEPVNFPVEAVPEPPIWAMMLMGFAGLGYAGYRRAKRSSPAHNPTLPRGGRSEL